MNKELIGLVEINIKGKLEDISVDCPYAKANFDLLFYSIARWFNFECCEFDEDIIKKYNCIGFN